MGFTTGDLPPVDPETFAERPLFERIRILVHPLGRVRVRHPEDGARHLRREAARPLHLSAASSSPPPPPASGRSGTSSSWWTEPIVYEKLILWTVLLETLGLAGSWGPLAGHFKPMTGGVRYWARPDTIRLPPWPDKVPFTRGDRRTVADVALYLAIVATLVAALVAPSRRPREPATPASSTRRSCSR